MRKNSQLRNNCKNVFQKLEKDGKREYQKFLEEHKIKLEKGRFRRKIKRGITCP